MEIKLAIRLTTEIGSRAAELGESVGATITMRPAVSFFPL